MLEIKELEVLKNRLIRECLKETVGDKDDKQFIPLIEDEETARKVRKLFLDTINILYKNALIYIAAQKGLIIQSLETLAKQDLPKDFSIEGLIERTEKRAIERKIQARRADGKDED